MAMGAIFTLPSPVVTGSAVYTQHGIDLYFQLSGPVYSAKIIELVISREQVDLCGAKPPKGFTLIHADRPLCPEDEFTPIPFATLPPRDVEAQPSLGQISSDGMGRFWILWCGSFRVLHGSPVVLNIPCARSLDQPIRMGFRYRYKVGFLMAQEYHPIHTGS